MTRELWSRILTTAIITGLFGLVLAKLDDMSDSTANWFTLVIVVIMALSVLVAFVAGLGYVWTS